MLDSAMQEVGDMYILLEETEKTAVRKALIEERGRFCCLVNLMTPAIVSLSTHPLSTGDTREERTYAQPFPLLGIPCHYLNQKQLFLCPLSHENCMATISSC